MNLALEAGSMKSLKQPAKRFRYWAGKESIHNI
jgi:hypothetical protein